MSQSQTASASTPAGRGNRLLAAFRPELLWLRVSMVGMPGRPFRPRIVLEGDPGPKIVPEVLGQQLGIVQDNLPLALLVNGVVVAILGLCFMTPATRTAEAAWILAFLLLGAWRYREARARPGGALELDRTARTRRRLFLGSGLQGLLWAVAGTFLLPADPLQQLFLIAVIIGVTAGAVIVYAPIWSAFALYAVPSLFPISLRLIAGPLLVQKLTGGLGLIYGATLLFMAARISRWLGESLELRESNAKLQLEMTANQQERLKAEAAYGPFSGQALVVDDEPEVLTTARLMLESLGMKVATARNGLEALAFMGTRAADINVVLLDLTMPQMDGRQTLRALRRLCPELPVILSGGYDPRQAPTGARDPESPVFLQKPYTLAELRRVLAPALGPGPILI
jgi:CheY-like chemotaxis protein